MVKTKSARYGANIERALMVRKIKAAFRKYWDGASNDMRVCEIEDSLLSYASGQAKRSKARKGGL